MTVQARPALRALRQGGGRLKGRGLQIIQPQFEILDGGSGGDGELDLERAQESQSLEVGRIVPIYESAGTAKLTSRWFRRIIHGALENLATQIPDGFPPRSAVA